MKHLVLLFCLSLSTAALALGQTDNSQRDGRSQDEIAIRNLMQDVATAWNKHDVVAFSNLFAEDADFTNWRADERVHGREEVRKAHADLFAGMFRESKMTVKSPSIRFLAADIAAVECETELVGAINYDGKGTIHRGPTTLSSS